MTKQILVDHHPTLLGPGTSVGKMYLGPLYYYVSVPFLAITYPDPIGPALGVALLGIATVVLMYVLGKEMIGKIPAGIAALLYATAPSVVSLARFSWNRTLRPLWDS